MTLFLLHWALAHQENIVLIVIRLLLLLASMVKLCCVWFINNNLSIHIMQDKEQERKGKDARNHRLEKVRCCLIGKGLGYCCLRFQGPTTRKYYSKLYNRKRYGVFLFTFPGVSDVRNSWVKGGIIFYKTKSRLHIKGILVNCQPSVKQRLLPLPLPVHM